MEKTVAIEDTLRSKINRDIESSFGTEGVKREDPLGDSVYLHFLMKNNVESSAIDNLIDWMNSWIEYIVVEEKSSRFVDRELASALLGYYSLKSADRLSMRINITKVNDIVSNFLTNDSLFNNFTYSVIILFSLADQRSKISVYNRVFNWVRKSVDNESIFNDAKNIVFTCLLLDAMDSQSELKKLVDFCFDKATKNTVRFNDRAYYAWTLWKYRGLREERDLSGIVSFTKSTLQNITQVISEETIDESVMEMYGYDTKPGFSKILLATALDLLMDFNSSRITVSLASRVYIDDKLNALNWKTVLRELDNCQKAFEEGRMGDCCNNLRMGLITTLVKMYEHSEKRTAPTPPGKTTDIRPLLRVLEQHGLSKDAGSLVRTTWSYVSERAHIEKRGGQTPSEVEARYGIQITFAAIEFLLRLID